MEPHKGSVETYNYIAKWIAPNFFYSVNDVWHRFGMLGVFGDYILSCTQGDILEIGAGESSIYLSSLARKYNRHMYCCDIAAGKIDNPLTVEGYLAPERTTFFRGPSDDMFKQVKITPLAIAFIDGDHNFEQARRDFHNIDKLMVDNGWIMLHDTWPPDDSYIDENRCGTVYKLRQEIEQCPTHECMTLTRGCAMGVGLTMVRKKPLPEKPYHE